MSEKKKILLHSEQITDIMGDPPRRIVRTGTSLIFILFLLMLFFSWIIHYPDTVPAQIEITTTNPPVTLVSKVTGHIRQLYVSDKDTVRAGQLAGIMETTASPSEIRQLSLLLDTMTLAVSGNLPAFYNLGELQEYYAAYRKNLSDLDNFDNNDIYGSKIAGLTRETEGIRDYMRSLKIKEKYNAENERLERNKFMRDSALFRNGVISEAQVELSRQMLNRNRVDLVQVRLDYSAKQIELAEKMLMISELEVTRAEQRESIVSRLEESFLNLKAQMKIWENTYYLVSPVNGIAAFTKYWSVNQSVTRDEPVMSVIPLDPGEFEGRINLRMNRSGKVKEGQPVNIKLSGYPYLEYGMVRGTIRSKSLVPAGDSYIIEIDLPQGLTTLYGRKLEFTQNMQGTAEIITEDLRLIMKILNPFRHLVSKNKASLPS